MIAMLAVLALAGMGAVILVSVTSESQVARNERWAEEAAAQAEAGLEAAKVLLAAYVREGDDFEAALPPARSSIRTAVGAAWGTARPADGAACRDPGRPGCRDYEWFRDQLMAGGNSRVYVGRVLRDPGGRALLFDPRAPETAWAPDLDGDRSPDLAGVTVWIRRPVVGAADAGPPHDRAILTAEARYPPPARPETPHAVSRLELTLRLARRPDSGKDSAGEYGDGLTTWVRGSLSGGVVRGSP